MNKLKENYKADKTAE